MRGEEGVNGGRVFLCAQGGVGICAFVCLYVLFYVTPILPGEVPVGGWCYVTFNSEAS